MGRSKWKVYLNYGYGSEIAEADKMEFGTQRSALEWCRSHGVPLRCAMREDEWKRRKEETEDIVLADPARGRTGR